VKKLSIYYFLSNIFPLTGSPKEQIKNTVKLLATLLSWFVLFFKSYPGNANQNHTKRGRGQEGEMAQIIYAHMNNNKKHTKIPLHSC
jgi:hypothetical protein